MTSGSQSYQSSCIINYVEKMEQMISEKSPLSTICNVRLSIFFKILFTLELIFTTSRFNKFPDKWLHEGGLYEDRRDLMASTKKGFSITEKGIPQLTNAFNQAWSIIFYLYLAISTVLF